MNYRVEFSKEADRSISKWKKSNPSLYKKFEKLLVELVLHPRTGMGHPEPLVGGNGMVYSRHITADDRLIYQVFDDSVMVIIISVEGHYDDK